MTIDRSLIIFENNELIIVHKPDNTSFHIDNDDAGFFNLVSEFTGIKLWPVHRLDKLTSGLIIFAKSASIAAELGKLFEQHKIKKTYLAISDKKPKKKQGKIIGDMKKVRSGSWKLSNSKENPAITHFFSHSIEAGKRLFWLEPKTGKTHQLRVALKSIGSPILGDKRYSGSDADRGYLHAYKIEFSLLNKHYSFSALPLSGESFVSTNFQDALKHLRVKAEKSS
ncbi:TIGR01621 family pseudouridine synthase [Aliikangiella sp. G2MR2-5]|uniref:TIGR01621 family pseudouridine synthase n=1 Tax=Aliikangiella sp. G2MR2-5 TaxID=2788943 RepID=UPI0018AC2F0A|nr:TIGR01621 family pseudouridine synthase [Aliikangiella sp. G2MR2-5]